MPSSDSLQPPLSPAEREISKSYGGWTGFMQSMGLKPWNDDDAAEGKAIIAAFASDHAQSAPASSATQGNQTSSGGSAGKKQ
ncbi:hypothetical protein JX265_010442 [Neoarthrinium moseri]|uniref:Uncharacterized protein n=1 Tax=Neoarthrinium moseri TaxID=1658444 RepID=A0A9P9WEI2_9PEZI|nr:uncharacterized protein JN550_006298 [Neoarthrinium moseri]KAI1840970.1 hypothetical protein JX266_012830 [Neoarthrinium moseri]KAI1859439.1 hypothetical protein JX265_010442 [Neoarthrinium moseri]KAI1868723.1 hypothetical protein JN550_006298 [Neoarthrinium moseri]